MIAEAPEAETLIAQTLSAGGPEALRRLAIDLAGGYARHAHAPQPFAAGADAVPVSGKVVGEAECRALVDASLDMWLTTGRFNRDFERGLAARIGTKFALTCNSGSSANLLALSALTSPFLRKRALRPGDEVITCATGFPTTVNPALQYGLVPVFVDVDIPTYNIRADRIEAAITDRTRAIMVAHTLGNPFDLAAVTEIARRHGLWLIEDCCDALGATYRGAHVGTFGDVGTLSFYPAHHITMGEGGAVFTRSPLLKRLLESMRDWGRDCWCEPGKDNTCGKRFGHKLGDLPPGYDHKYTYSHAGYNLKITDMQAAVGLSQLDRLDGFVAARRRNFALLTDVFRAHEDLFVLPEATPESDPSWFGFTLTLRERAPFTRDELVRHFDAARIGTRLLFGGNLTRQPYMQGRAFRVAGDLANSDIVTDRTFWIGLYPGLDERHFGYVGEVVADFVKAHA